MRDITLAFWEFVDMMSQTPAVADDVLFGSSAYRGMCEAVHSRDRLAISMSESSRFVFADVAAIFAGDFEGHVGRERADKIRLCAERIQSWIDAEELSTMFGRFGAF